MPRQTNLWTSTFFCWPMRKARSVAWFSTAGFHHRSKWMTWDDDHRRLQAKIGELLMETELLYAKVDQLEAGGPLARRRSTR